jgi:enterochelin esterase-like enzyme
MKKLFWLSSLILYLSLAGCNFPYPTPTADPSEIPGMAKPSSTLAPTSTSTIPASPSPVPTDVPTPSATPTPTCAPGTVEQHQLDVPGMTAPLRFRVYLPPCYSETPRKPYPVLYMLHGQSFNESQWDDLGLDEAADTLISTGEIEPLIIVMPGEDKWLDNAITSKFGPAFIDQLIPWVDEHYSTCPQRACRAIGGLSRGAAWAMRLGILHPDLFAALGGHSLALFDGDVNYLPLLLTRMEADQRPKIYLDVGESDTWKASIEVFVAKLTYIKMTPVYLVQPGKHETAYWQEHAPEYLRWYAEALKQP